MGGNAAHYIKRLDIPALKEARANGVGPSSKRRRNDSNDPSVSIAYCLLMNLFCLVYVFAIICSQVNYFVISG